MLEAGYEIWPAPVSHDEMVCHGKTVDVELITIGIEFCCLTAYLV